MKNQISLVLFDKNAEIVSHLKDELQSLAHVTVVLGSGPDVTAKEGLDAIFLTWMQAVEFGAKPPFPVHEVRVMETPSHRVARGLPRYIVAGVALEEGEPREPKHITNLIIRELVKGIKLFNKTHEAGILRVGTIRQNLGLDNLQDGERAILLSQALEC